MPPPAREKVIGFSLNTALALSISVANFGIFGLIWSATLRHPVLAASGVSCARAMAMKAETTRLSLFPAWVSVLRMK